MTKKVEIDSRNVQKGDIFVAIPCSNFDRNVEEAIRNGASIIVSENNSIGDLHTTDARLIASKLAAFCYNGNNEQRINNCVAVTGTNGKSSVVHFLGEIWKHNNINSACLGTNGMYINGIKNNTSTNLTTPDCVTLHKIISSLSREHNIEYFAFEASSHALAQKRLHSVSLKVAAFTNLGSDHLDYHETKEEYFLAKQKIFTEIGADYSVFSKDDPYVFNTLFSLSHKNITTFGYSSFNDIYPINIQNLNNMDLFDLNIKGEIYKNIFIKMFGKFQILNVLCACSIALSLGLKISDVVNVLDKLTPLEGRMEHVTSYNGADIYVDYAHTIEGFRNLLLTVKYICRGRLITVFGCGGDRDKSKRSVFGEIAGEIANINIITDDNPRSEDPGYIRKEIIKNCKNVEEIADRKEAIKHAISLLENGDIMVVIGKGHETTQIYKKKILSHNDKEFVLDSIPNSTG
ncbi:MAG: UDP-N-acetylmuramoyl-L-alanyl-D-glutamate--2,6-diaminopimelate ligase [Holosporales bacterium]|jgi:UDP-N-acetylmuramoyl-L-alanyl-D-glutamate--2,6-diaminopimelate ligase|nr:UDP-N-acetylmuramoyl-L-alanyl-D-glutamate--2,6-diaminopimelate ligase [Holosporales bacterium]